MSEANCPNCSISSNPEYRAEYRLQIHSIMSKCLRKQIDAYKVKGLKPGDGRAISDFIKLNETYLQTLEKAEKQNVIDSQKLLVVKTDLLNNLHDLRDLASLIKP